MKQLRQNKVVFVLEINFILCLEYVNQKQTQWHVQWWSVYNFLREDITNA